MRASEVREMTPDEKVTRLADMKEELRGLRFGHVMQQVSNPLEIRAVRRDIARLETIIAEENRKAATGPAEAEAVAGGEEA